MSTPSDELDRALKMVTMMMWVGGIVGAVVLAAALKTLFGWG